MHTLMVGMSGSGKSTLAKMMARRLKAKGKCVAILDPLGDPAFDADFRTKDSEEFLAYAKSHRDCFLMVDEGGQAIGRYNQPMEWLATTGRHCGHLSTFIIQGCTQLSPIVRGQCSTCFLFACAPQNAEIISMEYNEEKLTEIPRLNQFEFVQVSRFKGLKKGKIMLDSDGIEWEDCTL